VPRHDRLAAGDRVKKVVGNVERDGAAGQLLKFFGISPEVIVVVFPSDFGAPALAPGGWPSRGLFSK
jgi:hypothetical protein